MRMSCNGCRVLRKGCSNDCSIRPCLQWIKNPQSQANATVFLAKFYGRAGLMNLINAGPHHLRPAIFRSLLYEACGRIVNPIYGSVGLLWYDSWQLCQVAVESVLKGEPIAQISSETAAVTPVPPFKAYDIRHVTKDSGSGPGAELHRVLKKATRTRFKRSSSSGGTASIKRVVVDAEVEDTRSHGDDESSGGISHVTEQGEMSRENESAFSVVEEESHVTLEGETETAVAAEAEDKSDVELELTLGFQSVSGRVSRRPVRFVPERTCDDDTCRVDLGL